MARQADHAHVVAEIFAAELRANASDCATSESPLQLQVAESLAAVLPLGRQLVEIPVEASLTVFMQLGGGPADHQSHMIGRARRGAEGPHLLDQERLEALWSAPLGFLEQVGLVGGPAAFGDEEEFVFRTPRWRRCRFAPADCCRCFSPHTSSAAPPASSADSAADRSHRRPARALLRRRRRSRPAGLFCP